MIDSVITSLYSTPKTSTGSIEKGTYSVLLIDSTSQSKSFRFGLIFSLVQKTKYRDQIRPDLKAEIRTSASASDLHEISFMV